MPTPDPTQEMQLLAASAVDNPARPWDPRDDAGYEHLDQFEDTDMREAAAGFHAAAQALAGVTAVSVTPDEHAGYVLLQGMQSPSGEWQWQAAEGVYRQRHLAYLERLKTEREAAHPEPFWRFAIAAVTIPGVPS